MKSTQFISQIESMYEEAQSDYKNPFLTVVKFIFADDRPNANNQGIKHADFPQVIQSAIDTPIKMAYLGEAGAGGHAGSVTIGHIRNMTEDMTPDGIHRLIAEGVVYAGEYPKEVQYLKDAYDQKKAPGASWEINYNNEEQEGPVQWLKGIITRAATFVRNPAYGTRTALLALASDNTVTDEELTEGLLQFVKANSPKNDDKGGSNKVTDEEITKLQAELEAKAAELEKLTKANAELTAKVTAQEEVIEGFKRTTLIAERTAKVIEAGLKVETDPEKLAKKQEFWAGLPEEAFAEYLSDLQVASKAATASTKTASASTKPDGLPRVEGTAEADVTLEEIRAKFKGFNRASAAVTQ